MKTEIKYGTLIMHAETRVVLGRVMRQSAHFYTYQKQPSETDYRRWARIRKDLAMPVPAIDIAFAGELLQALAR